MRDKIQNAEQERLSVITSVSYKKKNRIKICIAVCERNHKELKTTVKRVLKGHLRDKEKVVF